MYVCAGAASSQQAAPSAERLDGRSQHPLRQGRERGRHPDVHGDHKTGYETTRMRVLLEIRTRLAVADDSMVVFKVSNKSSNLNPSSSSSL